MANEQKTPISRTLPKFVAQAVVSEILQTGRALPGVVSAVDGPIITATFNVTGVNLPVDVKMPIFGPEYVRYPIQEGDKGSAWPMPLYMGSVTGIGDDVPADFNALAGTLQLMWFPCGNKNWSASDNPNAVVIYGPEGVIIRDTGKNCVITVTTSEITVDIGGTTILEIDDEGATLTGDLEVSGTVTCAALDVTG